MHNLLNKVGSISVFLSLCYASLFVCLLTYSPRFSVYCYLGFMCLLVSTWRLLLVLGSAEVGLLLFNRVPVTNQLTLFGRLVTPHPYQAHRTPLCWIFGGILPGLLTRQGLCQENMRLSSAFSAQSIELRVFPPAHSLSHWSRFCFPYPQVLATPLHTR